MQTSAAFDLQWSDVGGYDGTQRRKKLHPSSVQIKGWRSQKGHKRKGQKDSCSGAHGSEQSQAWLAWWNQRDTFGKGRYAAFGCTRLSAGFLVPPHDNAPSTTAAQPTYPPEAQNAQSFSSQQQHSIIACLCQAYEDSDEDMSEKPSLLKTSMVMDYQVNFMKQVYDDSDDVKAWEGLLKVQPTSDRRAPYESSSDEDN
jgi:hypothetical protein